MRPGWRDGVRRFGAMLATAGALAAAPPPGAAAGEPDLGLEGLVSGLRANGAHVLSLGSRGGLDGYFVTPARGAGYSLYVTEDGHAVAGLLYGPDGMEITGAQLATARPAAASAQRAGGAPPETLVPQTLVPETLGPSTAAPAMTAHATPDSGGPASSSPSRTGLFERSAAAFGFTLGERGPLVVLLGDPTCSFSRSAAARLGRAALDGRLQLRVVPVAVLGAEAARRAVAIAAHPEPARAWFEGGAVADLRAADTRAGDTRAADRTLGPKTGEERIARNNALFDAWGATAVPLIAWQTPGGAVGHRIGDIDDVGGWLRDTLRVVHPQGGRPSGRRPSGRRASARRRP